MLALPLRNLRGENVAVFEVLNKRSGPFTDEESTNLGRLANSPKVELDIYAGGGGFAGALSGPCGPGFITCGGGAAYVGARMPLGVELLLKEAPFTFGVEIAPGLAAGNFGLGFILDFLLIARILF